MLERCVDERDFARPAELMDYLQRKLDFPAWFGGNLRALNDCLGDISEPTRITIIRRDPTPDTWFDRATIVIVRAALENDYLEARVR